MVNLFHSSVWIAIATSAAAVAAPPAPAPAPAPASVAADATTTALPGAPDSFERRIAVASRFVALTSPPETFLDGFRTGVYQAAFSAGEVPTTEAAVKAFEEQVEAIMAAAEPTVRKRMPYLLDAMAKAYAREFSESELNAMIDFAASPAGRHFLASSVDIASDQAVVAAQQLLIGEFEPALNEMRRKHCAKRAEQRIAAGDTKARCPLSKPEEAAGD